MKIPRLDVEKLPAPKPFKSIQRESNSESEGVSDSEPLPLWTDISTPRDSTVTRASVAPASKFPGALPLGIDAGDYLSDGGEMPTSVDFRVQKPSGTSGTVTDHRKNSHSLLRDKRNGESDYDEIGHDYRVQAQQGYSRASGGNKSTIKDHRLERLQKGRKQRQNGGKDAFSVSSVIMEGAELSYDGISTQLDRHNIEGAGKDKKVQRRDVVDHRKTKEITSNIKDYRKEALKKSQNVTDYRKVPKSLQTSASPSKPTDNHRPRDMNSGVGQQQKLHPGAMSDLTSTSGVINQVNLDYDSEQQKSHSASTKLMLIASAEKKPKALRPLPALPTKVRAKRIQQLPSFRPLPALPRKRKLPNPKGSFVLVLTLVLPWLGDDAREVPGEFMEQREYEGKFIAVDKLWHDVTHLLETKKRTTGALITRWIRQRADDAIVKAVIREMVWEVRKRAMYTVRFKRYIFRNAKRLAHVSYFLLQRTAVATGVIAAGASLLLFLSMFYFINNFLLPTAQLYLEFMFPEMSEGHESPIHCMQMLKDNDGDLLIVSGTDDGFAVMWNILTSEDDDSDSSSEEEDEEKNESAGTKMQNAVSIGSTVNAKPQGFYKEKQKMHSLTVTCLYYFRDHTKKRREFLATGCLDGSVRLWSGHFSSDHVNLKLVQNFKTHVDDDSDDDSLEEWEMTTKEKRRRRAKRHRKELLRPPQPAVTSLHATKNGYYLVAGFRENEAVMWVVESAEIFACFRCEDDDSDILCVETFQSESKLLLATGNSLGVSVWGVRAGWRVNFLDHDAPVTALHFLIDDESGESTQMITGDKEGVLRLWNTAGEAILHVFSGHCRPIGSIFYMDESMLGERAILTSSLDGTAKLWSIERRCVMVTMLGNEVGASYASAEEDEEGNWKLVVASRSGHLSIWDGLSLRSCVDEMLERGQARKHKKGSSNVPDEEEVENIKDKIISIKQEQQEAEGALNELSKDYELQQKALDDKKIQEAALERARDRQEQKRNTVISKYKRQIGLEMGLDDASAQKIVDGVLVDPTTAGSTPLLREIAVLHVELGEVGEQLGDCKKELRDLRGVVSKIPEALTKQQDDIVILKQQVIELEVRKDKAVNDIRRNRQRMQADLEKNDQELNSINTEIEATQISLDKYEHALAEATREAEDFTKQAKAHRKKANKLASDIQQKQKAINDTIEKYIRQAKESRGTPEASSQAIVDMVMEDGRAAGKTPLLKKLASLNEDFTAFQEQLRVEEARGNSVDATAREAHARATVALEEKNRTRTHLDDLVAKRAEIDRALQEAFAKSAADNLSTAAGRAAARKALEEEKLQVTLNQPSEVLCRIPVYPFLATSGRHLLVFMQLLGFPLDAAYRWNKDFGKAVRILKMTTLDVPMPVDLFAVKFSLIILVVVATAYTVVAKDYSSEWRLQWKTLVSRIGTGAVVPLEERREWLSKIAKIERNVQRLTYLHTFVNTVGLLIILQALMDAFACREGEKKYYPYKCGSVNSIILLVTSSLVLTLFGPLLTLGSPYNGAIMPKINRIPEGALFFDAKEWRYWFKRYFEQTIVTRLISVHKYFSRSNHMLRFSHNEHLAWNEYCASLHRRSPFIPSKNAILYNFVEGCVKCFVCITHNALGETLPILSAVLQLLAFCGLYRLSNRSPPYKSKAPNLWLQGMNLCLSWSAFMAMISSIISDRSNSQVIHFYILGAAVIMLLTGEWLRRLSGNFSSIVIVLWTFAVIFSTMYGNTVVALLVLLSPFAFAFLKLFAPFILRTIGILLCDRRTARMLALR